MKQRFRNRALPRLSTPTSLYWIRIHVIRQMEEMLQGADPSCSLTVPYLLQTFDHRSSLSRTF